MELDIFIPSLKLAFEYQGIQHFKDENFLERKMKTKVRYEKDREKKKACQKYGITLVEVPFWWDGTKESLLATVFRFRADIVDPSQIGTPIPEYWGELSTGSL